MRDATRPLIWFHAPSVGEGLQARPVIDLLRTTRPDVQIAYSFFSPSAERFAASLNVDVADFLPFDSAAAASALIDVLTPSALFFSKLDVWPNLVAKAKARGVTTGLLSGTVSPTSGRQRGLAQALLHDAYAALDVVGAIDENNGKRLMQMGVSAERLRVSGDTRFDQVWARAANVDRNSAVLQAVQSPRPTLVAGSTWPADETVLFPAWLKVKTRMTAARLIIAPHEPTALHVAPIVQWARDNDLSVATLSALAAPAAHTQSTSDQSPDVIVIDRTGVLGDLYAVADIAFVGGAFHKAGLHSVLEPAAYGVPVLFGPGYAMSREAGLLLDCRGALSVSTVSECTGAIEMWLTDVKQRNDSGERAKLFVQSELGAAERSLQLVLHALT